MFSESEHDKNFYPKVKYVPIICLLLWVDLNMGCLQLHFTAMKCPMSQI